MKQRQISEFEASLVYRVNSKTAKTIQRNSVLKNKAKDNNNKPQIKFLGRKYCWPVSQIRKPKLRKVSVLYPKPHNSARTNQDSNPVLSVLVLLPFPCTTPDARIPVWGPGYCVPYLPPLLPSPKPHAAGWVQTFCSFPLPASL